LTWLKFEMKILYATGKYSPLRHDDGSGTDYMLYHSLQDQGIDLKFVGPFKEDVSTTERAYRKLHKIFSKKRPAKYPMLMLKDGARSLLTAEQEYQPDLIFSKNLAPLVHFRSNRPIVYMLDAAVSAFNRQWPTFSKFENYRMYLWEKEVIKKACRVITRSEWTADVLVREYGYREENIRIVCNSSSLPDEFKYHPIDYRTPDFSTINLLLVGRVQYLKGIDIAIEVVNILNNKGFPALLRIVGLDGKDLHYVRFMGSFKKTVESELKEYANQYKWPHFLLHPARYDAAPIVTAEAASYGIPTLTNAVGGIATTVKNGVSGIVLPARSSAAEYVKAIEHYIQNPAEYLALRRSTRERYEVELNWEAAGKKIVKVFDEVIEVAKKTNPTFDQQKW
jgi:glycosyltransferase involved in cell wall biosynthesis